MIKTIINKLTDYQANALFSICYDDDPNEIKLDFGFEDTSETYVVTVNVSINDKYIIDYLITCYSYDQETHDKYYVISSSILDQINKVIESLKSLMMPGVNIPATVKLNTDKSTECDYWEKIRNSEVILDPDSPKFLKMPTNVETLPTYYAYSKANSCGVGEEELNNPIEF